MSPERASGRIPRGLRPSVTVIDGAEQGTSSLGAAPVDPMAARVDRHCDVPPHRPEVIDRVDVDHRQWRRDTQGYRSEEAMRTPTSLTPWCAAQS